MTINIAMFISIWNIHCIAVSSEMDKPVGRQITTDPGNGPCCYARVPHNHITFTSMRLVLFSETGQT
jgi:hypothetical protein